MVFLLYEAFGLLRHCRRFWGGVGETRAGGPSCLAVPRLRWSRHGHGVSESEDVIKDGKRRQTADSHGRLQVSKRGGQGSWQQWGGVCLRSSHPWTKTNKGVPIPKRVAAAWALLANGRSPILIKANESDQHSSGSFCCLLSALPGTHAVFLDRDRSLDGDGPAICIGTLPIKE
jgi:hypothetical protein